MDVELADPKPVSVDTLLVLLALGLVGLGGYRVFTAVGTSTGLEGWGLVAVGWAIVFPRLFLGLELADDEVRVSVVTGSRVVPRDEITAARVVDGWLILRLGGVGAARYHTGHFYLPGEGHVRAYASRLRGPFVLLERGADTPVVVSPAQPERLARGLGPDR